MGGTEKGRVHKDLKKGGQADSRGECLKKGGGGTETPLQTMDDLILPFFLF